MKDLVPMNLIHVSMIQVLKVNTAIIRTYKLKFRFREHYLKLYLQKSLDIQQMRQSNLLATMDICSKHICLQNLVRRKDTDNNILD